MRCPALAPTIEIIQVPHYGTRRAQADADQAEGERQEMLDNRLTEYQYLHDQAMSSSFAHCEESS